MTGGTSPHRGCVPPSDGCNRGFRQSRLLLRQTSRTAQKIQVFLLQLGAPNNVAAIEPFLQNLLEDVLPVPGFLRGWLARRIAKSRAPKVAPLYEKLGGGSPLLRNTEHQATALEQELANRGLDARVVVCMRYAPPRAEAAVRTARSSLGAASWVALPLYPQYSFTTTRSSIHELKCMCDKNEQSKLTAIEEYCVHPGYIAAMVECVSEGLARFSESEQTNLHLLFSAHGLPEKFVRAGDPYPEQTRRTVAAILKALPGVFQSHLTFQSRVGPTRWLTPETAATVHGLGASGVKNLLVIPVSFVSDHLETLHELDIDLAETARASGITHFERAPTVGTKPTFIAALADIVVDHLYLNDKHQCP